MTVVIRTTPGPFQFVFVTVAAVGGLAILSQELSGNLVQNNSAPQPGWLILLLSASLILGGSCTLLGMLVNRLSGALLERAGLVLLSGMLSAYSVVLLNLYGTIAFPSLVFFGGYVAASVWRITQIGQTVRLVKTTILEAKDTRSQE